MLFSGGVTVFNTSGAASQAAEANNITLYYITTREPVEFNKLDPLNPNYTSAKRQGYGNDEYQNFIKLKEQQACTNGTIVVFVHGWEESEKNVEERLNRVKLSLANNNYTGPLIGFSWPSDTVWLGAQFIAQANGPKLAKLIDNITDDCPDAKIRIIAHSMGARVVLNSLESLHQNPHWTTKNIKIASVHLMGAAVDDEEVSNRSEFVTFDQTNWGSPKLDYGEAIAEEVINFTNLFSSKDAVLKPNIITFLQIYPTFEGDLALGQSGYQKHPDIKDMKNKNLSYNLREKDALPKNYNEADVTNELIANCDADGDSHPDFPFSDGNTITTGDNHRGYLGYRDNGTKLVTNDGVIDVIVHEWRNKSISVANENMTSSSLCRDLTQ